MPSGLPGPSYKDHSVLRLSASDNLKYERDKIEILNAQADAKVTVLGNNSGLGRLQGAIEPSSCLAFDTGVDLGFRERVRLAAGWDAANASGEVGDLKANGRPRMFWIKFLDVHGNGVPLASALTLSVSTSMGRLGLDSNSTREDDWQRSATLTASEGEQRSSPVYVRLGSGDSGNGVMSVKVKLSNTPIHDSDIPFKATLTEWQMLSWIIAGGMVWWLASFLLDRIKKRKISSGEVGWTLLAVVVISIVAWRVDPSKVTAGLVDRTTNAGVFWYGLIVSAMGLDGLIKKLVP
jgi:hypothetical protein